jgi:putative copper export protein
VKTEPYPVALRGLLLVSLGALSILGAGLIIGGAADPLPLADPGPVVRFGQPIAKLILNISMATAVGSLVLASFAANDGERSRLQPVASWAAAVWLFAGAANFIFTYLSASGSEVSYGAQFSESLWLFATQIELGTLLAFNLGFAFLLSLSTIAFGGRRMTAVNAAIAIAGLYPLAESGHASSDSGHALAVNSLLMHLIGISVWVGGLIALYAVFRAGNERTEVLVSRYSTLALLAFIAVGVSGAHLRLYKALRAGGHI